MDLQQTIEKLQTLCQRGDARAVRDELFADDATVCGEGAENITSGAAALLEALTDMLKVTPHLSIRAVSITELAEGAAVSWLEWSSPPAQGMAGEPMRFRSLTAWAKRGDAWVIVADMYGMGAFGA